MIYSVVVWSPSPGSGLSPPSLDQRPKTLGIGSGLFNVVDIILTAALLGGGVNWIRKILGAYSEHAGKRRMRSKATPCKRAGLPSLSLTLKPDVPADLGRLRRLGYGEP